MVFVMGSTRTSSNTIFCCNRELRRADIALTYLRKDGVRVDGRVPCSVWGLIGHVRLATESGGEREELVEGSRSVLTLLLIAEPIAIKGKTL